MQTRPPFDRGLVIAIAIGLVSMFGLAWIFWTSDLHAALLPPTVEPTAPFDFGQGSGTASPPPPPATLNLEETVPTVTGTSPEVYPNPPAETLPSASTMIAESPPAPSTTPAPDQPPPFPAGKYDDTDLRITYDRYWIILKNPGTKNAYRGALHVSGSIGSEASLRFTGKQFYVGYQRGKNFGTVTVMIDDQSFSFHEQAFDLLWRSPQLSPGTHSVRIIHDSGESINLDYVQILD